VGVSVGVGVGAVGLAGTLIENSVLPAWTFTQVLNLAVWVVLGTCVVAWYHGEKGRQSIPRMETTLLAVLTLGWVATSAMLFFR
jgi:hypothetical protein